MGTQIKYAQTQLCRSIKHALVRDTFARKDIYARRHISTKSQFCMKGLFARKKKIEIKEKKREKKISK